MTTKRLNTFAKRFIFTAAVYFSARILWDAGVVGRVCSVIVIWSWLATILLTWFYYMKAPKD